MIETATSEAVEQQIVVIAPLGRNAEIIVRVLQQNRFRCTICSNGDDLLRALADGVGAILMTEEALSGPHRSALLAALADQPTWSDMPVTLLLSSASRHPVRLIDIQKLFPRCNVTVLQRPVPSATLISIVYAAIQARQRQYQVRGYLREREQRATELERRVKERTRALEQTGSQLRQARDLFQTLFSANPLPTAILRLEDARFIDVNDAFLRYFGYDLRQIVGHTADDLQMSLPHLERHELIERLSSEQRLRNLEMRIVHPSGKIKTALASVEIVEIDGSQVAISAFVDITDRVEAERKVHELASALTIAEQTERHRIAEVLHDDLQQRLYALQIALYGLEISVRGHDESSALQELAHLKQDLPQAIDVTRRLSVDLSPPILHDEGLFEALDWLAAQMQKRYAFQVDVQKQSADDPARPRAIEQGLRVLLFQIVRELLFNVVKHTDSSRAHVSATVEAQRIAIVVEDFGSGFDSDAVLNRRESAHGLVMIRRRLEIIGGRMKIKSVIGKGTRTVIEAPLS